MPKEFKVKHGLILAEHLSGYLLTVDGNGLVVNSYTNPVSGGGGGGGGGGAGIWVLSVSPTTTGNVGEEEYLSDGSNVLSACSSDTDFLTVSVLAMLGQTDTKPAATVNGIDVIFSGTHVDGAGDSVLFPGTADITLVSGGTITALHEDGTSIDVIVTSDTPPVISSVEFTGGYPGSQTEVKSDDTFNIRVQTDIPFVNIQIDNDEACSGQTTGVSSGTDRTIAATIADRGDIAVARPARVRVQKSTGSWSGWVWTNASGSVDGTNTILCNNLYPSLDDIVQGGITYPASQEAIKDSETVTVHCTATDFDTILYSSPNGDLSIPNTTTYQENKASVQRISGNYNISTTNYRVSANRAANDASTTKNGVVYIAHVAASLSVTEENTRLRSGGNDGTSAQSYTITITSDQNLIQAPTLGIGSEGTWLGGAFTGGPTVWTRQIQISDDDTKGTYAWGSIQGVNLANKTTSTITGDGNYILGGFVSRSVTLAAFSNETNMNVEAIDYTKVAMTWFVKSLPNKRAVGTTAVPDPNSWCLHTLNTNPTIIRILDTSSTGASSVPTTITIEESI